MEVSFLLLERHNKTKIFVCRVSQNRCVFVNGTSSRLSFLAVRSCKTLSTF